MALSFSFFSNTEPEKHERSAGLGIRWESAQLDKILREASEPTGACQETTRKSVWRPHQSKLDWLPGEPMKRNSFRACLSQTAWYRHYYHPPDVSHFEPWSSHPWSAQSAQCHPHSRACPWSFWQWQPGLTTQTPKAPRVLDNGNF